MRKKASPGEFIAVNRQRRARGQGVLVCRRHNQAVRLAHFPVEQADRVRLMVIRAEGIRANQLCQTVGLVGKGFLGRPHFVQNNGDVLGGDLVGGFATSQTATDNVDGHV